MPNSLNIKQPITLISPGRSGTSLLSNLFNAHKDVTVVGETANLIFGMWDAIDRSRGITNFNNIQEAGKFSSHIEVQTIQQFFVTEFSSNTSFWMQKPIGIPTSILNRYDIDQANLAGDEYWDVFEKTFPDGKYLTILRHPFDIILSAKSYWGWDEETMIVSIAYIAKLLLHDKSMVDFGFLYDDFVNDPENTTINLFDKTKVPYDSGVLKTIETIHASSKNRNRVGDFSFSRVSEWETINFKMINKRYLSDIQELYAKFGYELEIPKNIMAEIGGSKKKINDMELLKLKSNQLRKQIEEINFQFAKKLDSVNIEYLKRLAKLNHQNDTLVAEKVWLNNSMNSWKIKSDKLEKLIISQKIYVEELKENIAYLKSQNIDWEENAIELGEAAKNQQAYIGELKNSISYLDSSAGMWRKKSVELEKTTLYLKNNSEAWEKKTDELEILIQNMATKIMKHESDLLVLEKTINKFENSIFGKIYTKLGKG